MYYLFIHSFILQQGFGGMRICENLSKIGKWFPEWSTLSLKFCFIYKSESNYLYVYKYNSSKICHIVIIFFSFSSFWSFIWRHSLCTRPTYCDMITACGICPQACHTSRTRRHRKRKERWHPGRREIYSVKRTTSGK